MGITDYYIAMILSVMLSLLIEETFGLLSGGMIVPGILALHFNVPETIILILIISFIVYFLVEYVFAKKMILFGRRKFAISLILALLLKVSFEVFMHNMPFIVNSYRGISAIAPALLASTYSKQGIKFTLPTTLVISSVIYIAIGLIN